MFIRYCVLTIFYCGYDGTEAISFCAFQSLLIKTLKISSTSRYLISTIAWRWNVCTNSPSGIIPCLVRNANFSHPVRRTDAVIRPFAISMQIKRSGRHRIKVGTLDIAGSPSKFRIQRIMVRNVTGPWITYLPKMSTTHTITMSFIPEKLLNPRSNLPQNIPQLEV